MTADTLSALTLASTDGRRWFMWANSTLTSVSNDGDDVAEDEEEEEDDGGADVVVDIESPAAAPTAAAAEAADAHIFTICSTVPCGHAFVVRTCSSTYTRGCSCGCSQRR